MAARGSDLVRPHGRGQLPGRRSTSPRRRSCPTTPCSRSWRPTSGWSKLDATAHAMGITSPLDGNPAEVIGGLRIGVTPLEMADAYATLANGGSHVPTTIINKVVFPDGSYRNLGDPPHTQVFTDGEAYEATQRPQAGDHRAGPGRRPTTAARRPARPAPPTTSRTPGSSATRRRCRPPSGSATRRATSRCPTDSAARSRRRSGTTTCRRRATATAATSRHPTTPFAGDRVLRPLLGDRRSQHDSRPDRYHPSTTGTTPGATGGAAPTSTSPYNNPTLFAQPPQTPPAQRQRERQRQRQRATATEPATRRSRPTAAPA